MQRERGRGGVSEGAVQEIVFARGRCCRLGGDVETELTPQEHPSMPGSSSMSSLLPSEREREREKLEIWISIKINEETAQLKKRLTT